MKTQLGLDEPIVRASAKGENDMGVWKYTLEDLEDGKQEQLTLPEVQRLLSHNFIDVNAALRELYANGLIKLRWTTIHAKRVAPSSVSPK